MNVFYVYEHWRPDKNVCFYVGKGKNKRAWDMKHMRNRHHQAVVSKLTAMGLAVNVKIVVEHISNETAISLEIDRIAFYGMENLTNLTAGGDGMANPTPETRAKISASQKARFQRPEEMEKVYQRNRNRIISNETREKLSAAGKNRKLSEEHKQKLSKFAKERGISPQVRAAQKLAVTGKARAPFTEQTRLRMSEAAKLREQQKKERRI